MIYLLYGSDTTKSRIKLHELMDSLVKKKPDASHMRITDETFFETGLEELISGRGLFSSKTIVECDNVFRNKEAKEVLLEDLKAIQDSENIFVFLEGDLDKTTLKKFEKNSEKIQEFSLVNSKPAGLAGKDFNIFSLTDALGKRDKKQLWVLYQKAKMKDISDEEIHGILFWHVKSLIQAQVALTPAEAGLNPFVYQKSIGYSRNYSLQELKTISSTLVSLYHEARRGIVDFDVALEKFILEV